MGELVEGTAEGALFRDAGRRAVRGEERGLRPRLC